MTVLVIAPHPDDETLGCGGSIRLHVLAGERVEVVFLTSGEAGVPGSTGHEAARRREGEAEEAAAVLGVDNTTFLRFPDGGVQDLVPVVAADLTGLLRRVEPRTLYVPHPGEAHPDHAAAYGAVRSALRASPHTAQCLGYEVWSPLAWHDAATDISAVFSDKLLALTCHRSQLDQMDFAQAVTGLNSYRGATSLACAYAEVFRYLDPAGLS